MRDSFYPSISKPELSLHQTYDFASRYLHTTLALNSLLNLLSTPDALVRVDIGLNHSDYRCLLKYLTYFHLPLLDEVFLLALHVSAEVPHSLHLHIE